MKIKHNPNLKQLPHFDYRELKELQGNLKELNESNYNRLVSNIQDRGLITPFIIWKNPKDEIIYLLDGHQRKKVFESQEITPFQVPCIEVPGKDEAEAKKNLLSITSQYGTATKDGWDEFTFDIDEKYLKDNFFLDNLWREFDIESEFLSGGASTPAKGDKKAAEPKASTNDDDYSVYEIVLLHENKLELVKTINAVKEAQGFEKNEQALMHIINKFK